MTTAADCRSPVRYRLAVATLSFFAAILYVYQLAKQSLWSDEAASFVNARLSWHDFGVAMHHRDVFFAAYYAFLHLWTWFGTDEATLRLPSVIGAAAALPCMFSLASRLFGNKAGIIAAALLASNNLFILHVREARPYAWLVLFAILSSLAFLRASDSGKSRDWAWYVAACVLGACVHIFALLVPLSHAASVAFSNGTRPWKPFLLALGIVAVAIAPLAFFIVGQESASGRAFAGHGNPRDVIYLFRIFCGSKASAILYVMLGAFAYGRFRLQFARVCIQDSYVFLFCWMLVPPFATLAVSHFVPLFLETYLLVALPPLLLLVAAALVSLRDVRIIVLASFLFIGLNIPGALKTYQEHGEKEDWRSAVAAATTHASSQDAIVVFPAADSASLAYYERNLASGNLPTLVYPHEAYRVWLPTPAFDASGLKELARHYLRIWVLVNVDAPESNAQAERFEGTADSLRLVRTEHFTRILVHLYEPARAR